MEVTTLLKLLVQKQGSDLFFSAGARPHVKVQGVHLPVGAESLTGDEIRDMAYSLLDDRQIQEFEKTWEFNLGLSLDGIGRFRINIFRQRGEPAMVIRHVKDKVPSVEELNLPPILKQLVMEPRGLILVVGATGSGKSTTLAAMIEHRNQSQPGHILTIEDPIEFSHRHRRSIINQRELGLDTHSYSAALQNAMREAPDVILIGEIRDRASMQHAIAYAETGHLCLSTLHASNANQTLDRIVNFFPDSAHRQIYTDLSLNLKAVISQRLISACSGGLIPAVEVMLLSSYVSKLIRKGEISGIKEIMEQSDIRGMQTFDQALYTLYQKGRITLEEALQHADSRNDLSLRIRLDAAAGE
ncbi:MAG: PilT/PilU family type 4a pilus ATPase [Pseudomonadota bacterium]|nr:PilT/PilU family type 4a pilus ATPase [Pseudomonadota bacterium]